MFCSKCGQSLADGHTVCPRCGSPAAGTPLSSMSADAIQQSLFERAVRRLSRFWYLFAGLNLVLGAIGLFAFRAGFAAHLGPWEPWPHPPLWDWMLVGASAWTLLFIRLLLAAAAGWGLRARAGWGRPVAVAAAVASLVQFPIGFVLGVYTIAVLLGPRRGAMYKNLA